MPRHPPSVPEPRPDGLDNALDRNIAALADRRRDDEQALTRQERVAEAITAFTGSMAFVYLHLATYGLWIFVNVGVLSILPKFDPSFVFLATEASVEAIFLSTFVLISQNRTAAAADKRSDLDLQISLLAEHELTKLIRVVTALADKLGLEDFRDADLDDAKEDVAPEAVLDKIEAEDRA